MGPTKYGRGNHWRPRPGDKADAVARSDSQTPSSRIRETPFLISEEIPTPRHNTIYDQHHIQASVYNRAFEIECASLGRYEERNYTFERRFLQVC